MGLPDHHLQVGVLVDNEGVVATQLQQVLTKPVHKQVIRALLPPSSAGAYQTCPKTSNKSVVATQLQQVLTKPVHKQAMRAL